MVRGEAKRCTGHVRIETDRNPACSCMLTVQTRRPYNALKRVECIGQSI